MLCIALHSRWLIAQFAAAAFIQVIEFLFMTVVISLSACYIWVLAFQLDVLLMLLLRDSCKVKRNEPIRFNFDGYNYEPFVTTLREEIAIYLSTRVVTAEMTAETLDCMLPANQYLKFPHTFVPSSVLYACRLWETLAQFAFQIPHNHVLQDKLVDLIVALSQRPAVLVTYHNTLLRFWDAMPHYDTFITVYGNAFFHNVEWRHTDDEIHKTNLMAFIARVQATGLPHGLMFGAKYSLHAALDEKRLDHLPWAVSWIDHCGEYLWWYVSQPSNNDFIFSKPMWNHYMKRFDDMACDARNERYVRMLAQDAFYTMARLTRSTPNTKFDDMGQKRWETILAQEGPQGEFEEPIAPDFWEEAEQEDEDEEEGEEAYWYWDGEDYILRGGEEDPDGFHPLRPIGGYLAYSDMTEEDESVIARAA